MLRISAIALLFALFVAAAGCSGGPGPKVNTPGNGFNPSNDPSPNSPSTISISPASETLRTGGQRRFSGWDSSVGQYDVIWSLLEGPAAGTITADGLYTAPSTPGTFHLIATSSHNPSLSNTASLKIVSVGFASIGDMAVPRSGHTAKIGRASCRERV